MASQPKKFDAVTVVGLALAAAIMIYGMKHTGQPQTQTGGGPITTNTTVIQGTVNPQPAPAEAIKEAPATPDVTVTGKYIELTFASLGGTLKSARLPDQSEDPSKKDKKGLDLLAEIVPGKRAFGIPRFEIGTRENRWILDDTSGRSPDKRVWALSKDTGAFDARGIRTLVYELVLENYTLTKTFNIDNEQRFVTCEVKVENKSDKDVECMYWINGPQGILLDVPVPESKAATQHGAIQAELASRESAEAGAAPSEPEVLQLYAPAAKTESEEGRYVSHKENLWGAVKNRFFMASLVSLKPAQLIKIRADSIESKDHPDPRFKELNIGLMGVRAIFQLNKQTAQADPYALYLGPADDAYVVAAETAMQTPSPYYMRMSIQFFDSFNWRWPRVDWLARQMMWLFNNLYKLFHSFGVAVVLMTIIIKMCIHPLQRKMMVSMSKMQKLQPEMKKITDKYKNATGTEAKLKMSQEQRHLMQQHGASPAGGCLPMLIQLPIFTALYGIFNHAFEMRGAEFLWIKDLSQPDRLVPLNFWPYSINLLPILYSVLSILQSQFMTPQQKSDDPQQEMNRKMMKWFPLVISLMFYSMPAGLVLYFAVSACWGMLESWYIKKHVIKDPGAAVVAPGV